MADTVTFLEPDPITFPYMGLDQLGTDRSRVPRAEIAFSIVDGVVTAGAVGETQLLAIACVLPTNFAYSLAEIHVGIDTASGAANTWNTNGIAQLGDATAAADRLVDGMLSLTSPGLILDFSGPMRVYTLNRPLKTVLVPRGGDQARMTVQFNNNTNAAAVASVSFFASFYQYDIEQAHHYAVNTPNLIR